MIRVPMLVTAILKITNAETNLQLEFRSQPMRPKFRLAPSLESEMIRHKLLQLNQHHRLHQLNQLHKLLPLHQLHKLHQLFNHLQHHQLQSLKKINQNSRRKRRRNQKRSKLLLRMRRKVTQKTISQKII